MFAGHALILLMTLAACGTPVPGPGVEDLAMVGGPTDDMTSQPADMQQGSMFCHNAGCRTFASYCSTDPCKCLALIADHADPMCTGTMVTCTVNPCTGKSAVCSHASGMCTIQ